MMLAKKLLSGIGDEEKLFVDDVFSAYTYTGNSATRTINNGIDLAGKGGLVWYKQRNGTFGHQLYDTFRGATEALESNSTAANATYANGLTAFNDAGYTLGLEAGGNSNLNTFVSWTFRRSPKFFDVVTYTGNGGTNVISHALGSVPGMIIVKRTNAVSEWIVQHRSVAECGFLNLTNGFASAQRFSSVTDTAITTAVSTADTNASGGTYVAYLFAHDPSADGIIQCGSFTTDGSGNATVNLGWEPQYLMIKPTSTTGGWNIVDVSRPWSQTQWNELYANTSAAETSTAQSSASQMVPTSTGFRATSWLMSSQTYIYLAIRRPNKPPTVGTQVYNAIARTGTGAAATVTGVGFAPDLVTSFSRQGFSGIGGFIDRLRGVSQYLNTNSANAESSLGTETVSFTQNGIAVGVPVSGVINTNWTYINHFFKRAPGFFDVVCYTGTGVARTVNHSLGVAPELIIVKRRNANATGFWPALHSTFTAQQAVYLNTTNSLTATSSSWNGLPTSVVFGVGTDSDTNASGGTYVAYLFATKAGISKVGSYTGNGSNQTIDCGFTTGARFVLIKATSTTGDWLVADTTRGIVAANDPRLSLNTTAAEVTTEDWLDPANSGFIVNQVAGSSANASGVSYIYLAFA